jgi:2,4-dienoyl-CoA reductase-like NADH-dependent reductase (Old Yellow Enzyme family)
MSYTRIASLKTQELFRAHLAKIGAQLPFDDVIETGDAAPLAQPLDAGVKTVGNRFAILPMEGWDGTEDGRPTDLTLRRWTRFGTSGAKLIWGGEAVAIRHDGRANPNQLVANESTLAGLAQLREALVKEHATKFGNTADLLIGLQLTHSGRFARPADKKRLAPMTLYRHPLLDKKFGVPESALLSDDEVSRIIEDFGPAARIAQRAGYEFVDLKHCHGYLGHEFLSAVDRPGKYGGSFENRTRFLREVVEVVRAAAPGMGIGVRLSAFDWIVFKLGAERIGEPEVWNEENSFDRMSRMDGDDRIDRMNKMNDSVQNDSVHSSDHSVHSVKKPINDYPYAFGGDGSGVGIDLTEPKLFLDLLAALGIKLVCLTAGSPYYNPHIQRPALFPPSDGYQPPEDPLLGVARQIHVAAQLKRHRPDLIMVGTGYSYLQEWLPNVAQAVVREGWIDSVGIGRMALAYPEMVADTLAGNALQRKRICRTFSDCTTGPRNGLVSGCYPLDDFYKAHPHRELLDAAKERA